MNACTAWYKPGADEEELTMAQQYCEDETGMWIGQKFIECMERTGWHHSHISPTVEQPESESPDGMEEVKAHSRAPDGAEKTEQPQRIESWYRVGEDSGQLRDVKAECREGDVSHKTFLQCMKEKGWNPVGIRLTIEEPGTQD